MFEEEIKYEGPIVFEQLNAEYWVYLFHELLEQWTQHQEYEYQANGGGVSWRYKW